MTSVSKFRAFLDELDQLMKTKENPDEWYVVSGKEVGEYSIHAAEQPGEVPDDQSDLPPEAQDATKSVDGFFQIGTMGWSAKVFDDDVGFVTETGFSETFDVIDRRMNGLLLVHESSLSEEALEVASEKAEQKVEA